MVVTSFSAVTGVLLGEAMTSQIGLSALAGGIATTMATVFLVIPRIMEQRRRTRETSAKIQADSIALLMSAHDRDVAFYKTEIAEGKLERANLIDAKHRAAGEWMAALNAYHILVGQLRELGHKPEMTLHPAPYMDIVNEADESLKATAAARVADTPPPK